MKKTLALLMLFIVTFVQLSYSQVYDGWDDHGCPIDEEGNFAPLPSGTPAHCFDLYADPGFPGNPRPIYLGQVTIHPENPAHPWNVLNPWFPYMVYPIGNPPGYQGTPCQWINALGARVEFRNKMQSLKPFTSLNYEKGFLKYGDNYVEITGDSSYPEIKFTLYDKIDGLIHSHPSGNGLSIFSYTDLHTFAWLWRYGWMRDPLTFTMGVVTPWNPQYQLIIGDLEEFNTFALNVMGQPPGAALEYAFNDYYVNMGNSEETNFLRFMQFLEDNHTGLKLFKSTDQGANWTPFKTDNNGNIINNPCN